MGNENGKGSIWTWVAAGCGGFVLLGGVLSCLGPSVFAMMFMDSFSSPSIVTPGPMGMGTGSPGLTLPEPEGPLVAQASSRGQLTEKLSYVILIEATEGYEELSTGDACDFDVEQLDRGGSYWCRTEFRCGETLLYGGPGQGFFECNWPAVPGDAFQAWDYDESTVDGDPSFTIDPDGTVHLRDGELSLEGRLTSAPPAED